MSKNDVSTGAERLRLSLRERGERGVEGAMRVMDAGISGEQAERDEFRRRPG